MSADANVIALAGQVGELKGTVIALVDAVKSEREETSLDRQVANQSRAEIHRRLAKLAITDDRLSALTKRVDEIEPVIADYKKKVAVASLILGAGFAIAFEILRIFSGEIKQLFIGVKG